MRFRSRLTVTVENEIFAFSSKMTSLLLRSRQIQRYTWKSFIRAEVLTTETTRLRVLDPRKDGSPYFGRSGMHYAWRLGIKIGAFLDIVSRIGVKDARRLCLLFLKFYLYTLVMLKKQSWTTRTHRLGGKFPQERDKPIACSSRAPSFEPGSINLA